MSTSSLPPSSVPPLLLLLLLGKVATAVIRRRREQRDDGRGSGAVVAVAEAEAPVGSVAPGEDLDCHAKVNSMVRERASKTVRRNVGIIMP